MSTMPPGPPEPGRDYEMLWLLLAAVLFAALLVGSGLYVFSRFVVRRIVTVHREVRERSLKIETPAGSLEASQEKPPQAELALPVYPNATPTGREGTLSLQVPLEANMRLVTSEYQTSDPFDKVVKFYSDQLGPAAKQSREGKEVRFSMITGGKQKWVLLQHEGQHTDIVLVNATEASGQ